MFRRLLIAAWMCCASCAFAQTTPVTPLPRAQTSLPYRVQLGAVVNGVYPFTFTFESLPTWLQHSSDGQVWGTPVTADETTQPVVFAATITDAQSRKMGRFMFSIAVSKDAVVPLVIAGTQATPAAAQPAAGTAPASAASPASPPPPPNTGTTPAASSAKPASMTIQPPTLHEPIEQGAKAVLGTARPLATVVLVRGKETPEVFQTIADQSGEFRIDLSTGDQKLKAAEDLQVRQIVDGVMSGSRHRTVTPYYRNGEELRAIVGYQQAGASAAKSEQNFFLDFYISRPLAFLHDPGDLNPTRLRWWGNVRVASYPQQGDVPVATFASSLITQFGQLKVNQLAQSAEYLSGLEINLLSGKFGFLGKSEETRQQFTLSLFGGGGATGPTETSSTLRVFEAPAAGTPQRPSFDRNFPGVTSQFIGFVSPDRDNFFRQYLMGLRLATTYLDKYARTPLTVAPAMLSVALGQNELVTGGRFHGMVLRTEAFYPLPFFNRSQDKRGALAALYLFGTAQTHFGRSNNITPLLLKSRPDIAGSDPNVTIVTAPSNRDTYRIGFGIDLVHTIMALTHPNDNTKADAGTAIPPPAQLPPVPVPANQ